MRGFKSKDHEIFTYETDKRSLSDFDDKRYYGWWNKYFNI